MLRPAPTGAGRKRIRLIFRSRAGRIAATQALLPTAWGRGPGAVAPANWPKPAENRNGERRAKAGMAARFRAVPPIPRPPEKGAGKSDPARPYREPGQVPLGEKPQACRVTGG